MSVPPQPSITAEHTPARPAPRLRAAAVLAWCRTAGATLVLLALVLLVLDLLALTALRRSYTVQAGTYRASFFLQNVSDIEQAEGESYRWTLGDSTFRLGPTGQSGQVLLTLEFGGRPAPGQATLSANGQTLASFTAAAAPQQVSVALPQQPNEATVLRLQSETFTSPGDSRTLGLKLTSITITPMPRGLPWPPLLPIAAQLGMLAAAWGAASHAGLGLRWRALLAGAAALALAVGLALTLPMADVYFLRLLGAVLVLALATVTVLPRLAALRLFAGQAHEARLLWLIMLVACGVRVVGAVFPTFTGQDLHYHYGWFQEILRGDLLLAVHSSEFGGGIIVYPPGTYVTLSPGVLITTDLQALLQGVLSVLDGSGALLVALLAYRLGFGPSVARYAAVIFTGSLPTFTAVAYGFSAQVFAQWWVAPLALGLLYAAEARHTKAWALAMLLLLFPLLLHIGVALLAALWVGAVLVLLWFRREHRQWAAPVLYVGTGLLALLFLYTYGLDIMLAHAGEILGGTPAVQNTPQPSGIFKGATPLLLKGARLAFNDVGLVLLPVGGWLFLRQPLGYGQRVVAGAWLATCICFFIIDLLLALQVRYFYFAVPIAAIVVALALGWISGKHRLGWLLAWALALYISIQGIVMWWSTTFGDVRLSLTPLTH